MTMDIYYILAGLVVGFCVGVTGVGGGSLMTPILILLLHVDPRIAVGTDLLYAAISKFCGTLVHYKQTNIVWSIVIWLAVGSIPMSILTNYLVATYLGDISHIKTLMTAILGTMLVITGLSVIFRSRVEAFFDKYRTANPANLANHAVPAATANNPDDASNGHANGHPNDDVARQALTRAKGKLIAMGMLLGVVVTLSSVGAGAFGVMALVLIFPQMPLIRIIGSDVAHAVLLTLVAGMGHILSNSVDFVLLVKLLIGAIPAIIVGTLISSHLPEKKLRPLLGVTLFLLGINFLWKLLAT